MKEITAHTLKPKKLTGWPDAVYVLAGAVKTFFASEADDMGEVKLDRFHAAYFASRGGKYELVNTFHGRAPSQFWRHVYEPGNFAKRVWIIAGSAREHAAFMGLWTQFSDGACVVKANKGKGKVSKGGKGSPLRDGVIILNGPPTIVTWRQAKGWREYTLLDVGNFVADGINGLVAKPADVQVAWDAAGCEHWELPDTTEYQAELLSQFWLNYSNQLLSLGVESARTTIAATAHEHWKRQYMTERVDIHDNPLVRSLERSAIHGGRVECRFIGGVKTPGEPLFSWGRQEDRNLPIYEQGPLFHLDVNSLYPAVAAANELPTALDGVCENPPVDQLLALAAKRCCVARVLVSTRVPCVPVRIIRDRRRVARDAENKRRTWDDGQEECTVYPVGQFWADLAAPEILLAAKVGKVKRCSLVAWYKSANLYREYVDNLHEVRLLAKATARSGMAAACKAMLNSPFGKWAQWDRAWRDQPEKAHHLPYDQWSQRNHDSGESENWRSLAWMVQREEIVGENADSFPAIAATICSLARLRLQELILAAGVENVFYYDTDSVFVNANGFNELERLCLLSDDQLGRVKLVDTYTSIRFYGLRRYCADGKLVCAGANGQVKLQGTMHACKRGQNPLGYYLQRKQEPGTRFNVHRFELCGEYLHGIVRPNGTVDPLTMDVSENNDPPPISLEEPLRYGYAPV